MSARLPQVVVIKASGEVFLNQIYTQLPISAASSPPRGRLGSCHAPPTKRLSYVSPANITIFRPSTFFIIAQTSLGLQLDLQLVPTMQLFVRLAPELRGQTCGKRAAFGPELTHSARAIVLNLPSPPPGLCGNFNSIQVDDFRTLSGVVEATAVAFFNTFKTQATCPNVRNSFEDPCSLSVENGKCMSVHWLNSMLAAGCWFTSFHLVLQATWRPVRQAGSLTKGP
ncbi:hypothetical protein P7K49_040209 [Saguinus oedipus]|uniref:VWFD domain-containing protein n=1 Tax=Saguinus oedipus TaxID=9490 RepID=A0ABQ9T8N1_SAGOE|nr:hypothetical protein P7K49_040209 [Saguinus oedipus]